MPLFVIEKSLAWNLKNIHWVSDLTRAKIFKQPFFLEKEHLSSLSYGIFGLSHQAPLNKVLVPPLNDACSPILKLQLYIFIKSDIISEFELILNVTVHQCWYRSFWSIYLIYFYSTLLYWLFPRTWNWHNWITGGWGRASTRLSDLLSLSRLLLRNRLIQCLASTTSHWISLQDWRHRLS